MKPTTSISNIQVYGAHAAYKTPPSEAQADAGVVPLDTLPAAWWNQLWYDITSRNNSMVETVLDIRDEILSVLADANIPLSALQTNQLLQAIEVIRRRFPTFDAISHDPIPGSVISSAARNSVSVDSATGQMTPNALSDWSSPDSVKTVIDNIINGGSGSIASLEQDIADLNQKTGNLANLTTTDKSNLVAAINEVNDKSNLVQYSTSEFDMRKKWIDGKQIYGRVLTDPLVRFSKNTSFPANYTVSSFIIFKGMLCVGTHNHGIYTSTDGITFTQNTSFPSNYTVNSFIIFNDTLYVGTGNYGIYTSTDGTTFTYFPLDYSVRSFIIFKGMLCVGTGSHGIYTSTDGITFTQNTSFPSNYTVLSLIIFNGMLYVGTFFHGIYTSTDGITFTQNTSFPADADVYSFIIFNNTLYVGTNNYGIYTSTNGITFTQNTSFPSNYTVNSFIIFNGTLYAGTGSHGIYTSTNGITFTRNTFFPSPGAHSFIIFNDTLYVGTDNWGIYASSTAIGFATALSNIAKLLFTQLRNSIGSLGLKSAYIDTTNHLVVECDGTPTQAIVEYTKAEA